MGYRGAQEAETVPYASAGIRDGRLPVVCVAEDRASCEPALRILAASLADRCPGITAHFYCPNATSGFSAFMRRLPGLALNEHSLAGPWTKYDIKPVALLDMLDRGHGDVLWIDSDILVTRDIGSLLRRTGPDTILLTEEALCSSHGDPDGLRARLWDLPVGRTLPFLANTGIVRVGEAHRALLERWREMLEGPVYRTAQALPWHERGLHVMGDQEVLTALLASEEFSGVPIRFLRRGPDIVQFFGTSGYTTVERVRHLLAGPPPFVHSQGYRPWWSPPPSGVGIGSRFRDCYNALSPYTIHALRYRWVLTEAAWLRPRSRFEAALRALGFGRAALVGLPLAIVADMARLAKRWRRAI